MGNIVTNGPTVSGTGSDDVIVVQESPNPSNDTIHAGDGNDTVIADHDIVFVDTAAGNNALVSATSIDTATRWSMREDPDFPDSTVPHTTVVGTGADAADWFAVTVGAGQTITADIDHPGGGFDSILTLYDSGGNQVRLNDDYDSGQEGFGSTGSRDSFATYTAATQGTYFIRVTGYPGSTVPSGASYLLNVSLTGHAATSTATSDSDTVYGEGGNDTLYGGGGDDTLYGGQDSDTLFGGAGNDVLYDEVDGASDTFYGGSGDDSYRIYSNGGATRIVEESGNDTVSAIVSGFGWTIDLEAGTGSSTGASLTIEGAVRNATGSSLNDTLTASHLGSKLYGNDGDDVLNGGTGDDTIEGGAGNDTMAGGGGVDTVSYASATAGVSIRLGSTGAQDTGGSGFDTISGFRNFIGSNYGDLAIANNLGDRLMGGAGDDYLGSGLGDDYLDGGAGTADLADYLSATSAVQVSLAISGPQNTGGAGIDTLVGIEQLAGSIYNDRLIGNAGDNVLGGGVGADRMEGGAGNDLYYVDNVGDIVIEGADGGQDGIFTNVSYSIAGQYIENVIVTTSDGANITGNGLANFLSGGSGADRLNGAGGADIMSGGLGNDRYYVDNVGDQISESAGQGIDSVESSISFVLNGTNVENLRLTGSAAIDGTGSPDDNQIIGNSGKNVLDGFYGADDLRGGKGDDTYYVDDAGDTVTELDGEGSDKVISTVSFSLAGQYVEVLELDGGGAINGTGNSLNNRIVGNSGANILSGGAGNDRLDGGAGADKLIGGTGNDTYVVDNASDLIVENDGEGTDTVEASFSYSIAGQYVEILTLTGTANINATGNGLANTLYGNTGNNTLNGGTGADTMTGGAGNDVYVVDNAGDRVFENADEGTDSVQASVTFSIAGQYVENLTLTGSAAINGTGNGLANGITGNNAANILNGGAGDDRLHGGLGSDTLTGGAGLDSYWFQTTLGAGNVDTITDFSVADDTIQLDRAIFAGIAADGTLAAAAFFQGTAAHDASDRIVYDKATGKIWYDADGTGAGAAVLFAQVAADTALTNADFVAFS